MQIVNITTETPLVKMLDSLAVMVNPPKKVYLYGGLGASFQGILNGAEFKIRDTIEYQVIKIGV